MDLAVLHEGIPEGAFKPVAGDSKSLASSLKKRNKKERGAQGQLSAFGTVIEAELPALAQKSQNFGLLPEETTADVRDKKLSLEQLRQDAQWRSVVTACNLWTAAFFMPLTDQNLQLIPTTELLERFWREQQDNGTGVGSLTPIVEAANQLAQETRFFHWPLEFPEVFGDGGFDCVLANPPWETLQIKEQEFFASKDPVLAQLAGNARKQAIQQLVNTNPRLAEEFNAAKYGADAQNRFLRESCRYPLTAIGKINTYAVFAETVRNLISREGKAGIIVPTGIATDDTCKKFFGDLIKNREIASLYDFENRDALFSSVHRSYKFSLLCISGTQIKKANFSFFSTQVRHLEHPSRMFHLTPEDIALINPNTLTCPIFRTRLDAELTQKIYQQVPVLDNECTGQNPWGIKFKQGLFNMTSDSGLFTTEPGNESVPLYEAKMLHQFDHRWATYTPSGTTRDMTDIEKQDPNCLPVPRYWVERFEVEDRLAHKWDKNWLIAFRDICRSTDERTAIFSILPRIGVGNNAPLMLTDIQDAKLLSCLQANTSSLVFDFITRHKVGGTHMNFFIVKQLPVLAPESYSQVDLSFITPRALELVYTTWDIQPFAHDMGYDGEPFPWNPNRRAHLRAELDAYYAYLYGLTRDELRYVLDPADLYGDDFPSETFRVLKKNEIKEYGEYRTQRLVLEAWDRLFEGAIDTPRLKEAA